nr:stalk domain-containing protein [Clostridium algifaecis]
MKKTIALLLGAVTIMGMSIPVSAADQNKGKSILISTNKSKYTINNNLSITGKNVNIGNLGVVINSGNVMVPLKITSESLGFKVSTSSDNKIITLDNDKIKTEIKVGVDLYYYESSHAIGCTAPESFGVAPMLVDNVVYVPIKIYNLIFNDPNTIGRFFCETKDGELVYVNNENYTIGSFVESKSNGMSEPIGIPSPIKEFNTIQEAEKSLKFKTVVPKEIASQFKIKFISTISNELFQICYSDGKNDILFRMGQGIDKLDGDYNVYKFNETTQVNGTNVNLKGNNSSLINLATWKINDISYSISVKNGMENDNIIKIIKSTF